MQCNYCERKCDLNEGESGFCNRYYNKKGNILERYPNRYSSCYPSHIESLPFFHLDPGSRTLHMGTFGCNMDCKYCSNAYIARTLPGPDEGNVIKPEKVVELAKKTGCTSISFGVNEPTVSYQTLKEVYVKAKEYGIRMGFLTNGYMTREIAKEVSNICSFVNISLKSLRDSFYQEYMSVPSCEPVIRNLEIFANNCHVEISTPIVGSDNFEDIGTIAEIISNINHEIPWHIFRLLPEYQMIKKKPPQISDITSSIKNMNYPLPYVYYGNFNASDGLSTFCPECNTLCIERISASGCGGKIIGYYLEENRCPKCGKKIAIDGAHTNWDSHLPGVE